MYNKTLIEAVKIADEELKNNELKSFEEVFGYPQPGKDVYNIKVEWDKEGNMVLLHVEKAGVTVEFDINSVKVFTIANICNEFDSTVKQGELNAQT